MNKEDSIAFLQKCIAKVENATPEDIQFYREVFDANCTVKNKESKFEIVLPTDENVNKVEAEYNMKVCKIIIDDKNLNKKYLNYDMSENTLISQQSDIVFSFAA